MCLFSRAWQEILDGSTDLWSTEILTRNEEISDLLGVRNTLSVHSESVSRRIRTESP